MRDEVACMMRIRNEGRWIRTVLERAFEVAATVVILNDGSDDDTALECCKAIHGVDAAGADYNPAPGAISYIADGDRALHFINSAFRPATVRPIQAVSEIRDKNFLWEYCKSNIPFRHMLCLDGDEILSKAFVKNFDGCIKALETQVDMILVPFIYLWDDDHKQRVDGIYGHADDGWPRLRFPRVFTIDRIPDDQLHIMRFSWEGTKGGFHCGSIPRENFRPYQGDPKTGTYVHPVIHLGYLHEADRQRKFEFYNRIDPNNKFEGEYRHIIGQPNGHAPGPLQFIEYRDE